MSLTISRRVGHLEVTALLDGHEVLTSTHAEAFPDIPADAHEVARAAHPGLYGEGDRWRLPVRAWLIRHPGGVIVMDTGVGGPASASMAWFPRPGRIHEALAEAGSSADQVDTVVISHVHDDHVGGTVTEAGTPAFPRARYLIHRTDLDALAEWAIESDEDRVVMAQMIDPLMSAGVVDPVEEDRDLADGIRLRHAPGHTPGHQVLMLASEGDRLIVSADTWNHPAQFGRPEWASGTDAEPGRATASRRALLADLLSHPGSLVAPSHLDAPFGRIGTGRDGRARFEAVPP
jgi:glyoxylase-like metal-dependent hydrolase (beta-lactamase superfamily II)